MMDSIRNVLSQIQWNRTDIILLLLAFFLVTQLVQRAIRKLFSTSPTPLRGPSSPSFISGYREYIFSRFPDDTVSLFETWIEEYGHVFALPSALGRKVVILTDPKAVAHFYARETYTYVRSRFGRDLFRMLVCFICFTWFTRLQIITRLHRMDPEYFGRKERFTGGNIFPSFTLISVYR